VSLLYFQATLSTTQGLQQVN